MAVALLKSRYFNRKGLLITIIVGLVGVVLIILSSTPVVDRISTVMEKDESLSLHSRVIVWGV